MEQYQVTITAIVEVSDPAELEKLIICKLEEDKLGVESLIAEDKDFKVIEYLKD